MWRLCVEFEIWDKLLVSQIKTCSSKEMDLTGESFPRDDFNFTFLLMSGDWRWMGRNTHDNKAARNFGEGRAKASRLLWWIISRGIRVVSDTEREGKSGLVSAVMGTGTKPKGERRTEKTAALCFQISTVYYSSFKGSFFCPKALAVFWCQMI